jgi:hypothetical protein
MVKSPPLEQRDDVNAQVDIVLKKAGLDASPMDPASMEALKEFFSEMPKENDPFTAVDDDRNHENRKPPPLSLVEQTALQLRVSTVTHGTDTYTHNNDFQDHDSAASGAGASPTEQKILNQLQQQTKLIWQLHQRIETLTTTVEKLAANGGEGAGAGAGSVGNKAGETRESATPVIPRVRRREVVAPRVVRPDNDNVDIHPNGQADPLPLEYPQVRGVSVLSRIYQSLAAIPDTVRNSRMAKIAHVYMALRQREAPNFDLGLIFKVLIMVTVFMARMSSSRKNTESFMWMYRTYLLGSFIILGFLLKTGYLKFMHAFIVKENYPGRIWNGEEIDIDNLPPLAIAAPRPVVAAAAPNENGGPLAFLQRTLLAGHIPRMDPARRGAVVLNAIQDLICLVGSFFLSIFPMWAPEAQQQVERQGPPAPPPHIQERLAQLQQQQQQQQQQPQQQQQQQQQLPGVQPPADAFQAEADDNAD